MKILSSKRVVEAQIELNTQDLEDIKKALTFRSCWIFNQLNSHDEISVESKACYRDEEKRFNNMLERLNSI